MAVEKTSVPQSHLFWCGSVNRERLRERRLKDPSVSQEAVFEELNEEFREVFGEDRFSSFDAFRKRRDRYNSK